VFEFYAYWQVVSAFLNYFLADVELTSSVGKTAVL
jgi:hypothetical protein